MRRPDLSMFAGPSASLWSISLRTAPCNVHPPELRSLSVMSFYTSTILPLAFRLDAERAHHLAIGAGAMMRPFARALHRLNAVQDPRLETVISGLRFPTPLGLAAGFDKSGTAIETLAGLGFGFYRNRFCFHRSIVGQCAPSLVPVAGRSRYRCTLWPVSYTHLRAHETRHDL